MIDMSWDAIGDELRCWYASGDQEAGRSALAFLESELRRMVPGLARWTWPPTSSLALGDRVPGGWTLPAAALFGLGVYLHLSERHGHPATAQRR